MNEQHGGRLPADAILRADAKPATPSPTRKRQARSERFAIFNAFTDYSMANLTGAEVKVWMILFRDTKAATGIARTGQADIARRAGVSVRAVKNALAKLRAKGLVRSVHRGRLHGGPSSYRVHSTGTHGEA